MERRNLVRMEKPNITLVTRPKTMNRDEIIKMLAESSLANACQAERIEELEAELAAALAELGTVRAFLRDVLRTVREVNCKDTETWKPFAGACDKVEAYLEETDKQLPTLASLRGLLAAEELFTGETTDALLVNILRCLDSDKMSRLGRALLVRSGDIPAELEHQQLAARAEVDEAVGLLKAVGSRLEHAVNTYFTDENQRNGAQHFLDKTMEFIKRNEKAYQRKSDSI